MITLQLNYETGDTHTLHLDFPVKIGREHTSDVVISHWRVSKCHCQLLQLQDQCFVEDQGGLLGTLLNGRRVMGRQLLNKGDQLIIGPCLIQVIDVLLDEQTHQETDLYDLTEIPLSKKDVLYPKQTIPLSEPHHEYHVSNMSYPHSHVDDGTLLVLRKRLSASLKQATDLRRKNLSHVSNDVLREEMGEVLVGLIESDQMSSQYPDRDALVQTVLDEILGLGVLEPLLADEEVSEIMVNRYDQIYIEKAGKIYPTGCKFTSEEALREVVNRIVSPLGRRIDESSPMVDGRLHDGSRMNAVIPPIALQGTNLTIRKFKHKKLNIEDLIDFGALDQYMARFLQYCVKHKKNIIVSGGTGSGKTTLLNILSNFIPEDERLITIEDSAELKLKHQHLISLEGRPENAEGKGIVSIRDLVRNALRMRPDRIIVGECRGGEAFDMMSAMNSGHEGSLTTLHANNPRDALVRLETMILMLGMNLPLNAIREHIAGSVHMIIQQARLHTGQRVVTSIVELSGLESGVIQIQELFRYQSHPKPCFVGMGILPSFIHLETDDEVDASWFSQCSFVEHV